MSVGSVRRATVQDVPELVRLRAVMYDSWGSDTGVAGWRESCAEVLTRSLATPDEFGAFVVDGPHGGLVSSGVGWVERHLPSPRNLTGRRGHIASMSTDQDFRRRGLGTAVLQAMLDWFAGQGIVRVDLRATVNGEPVYRAAGFGISNGLPMSWHPPGGAEEDPWATPSPLTERAG